MRNTKYLVLIFFIFSICNIILAQNNDGLILSIELQKKEYLKGEPVWLKIKLNNRGAIAQETEKLEWNNLKTKIEFHLFDSHGNKLRYLGPQSSVIGKTTQILKPGEEISEYYNILMYLGEPYYMGLKFGIKYLPSDSYSLFVTLKNSDNTMQSNEVLFNVEEPTGSELEVFNLFVQGLSNENHERSIDLLTRAIEDYPKSVYAEQCYHELESDYIFGLKDSRKAIEISKNLIEKHPKSFFVKRSIIRIIGSYKSLGEENRIEAELSEISQRYKTINPEIEKIVEKKIGKIK